MRYRLHMLAMAFLLLTWVGCSDKEAAMQAAADAEAAAEEAKRASHPDFEQIKGTWKIVTSEWDGDPNERAVGNFFTFENARMKAWIREIGDISLDYEIDPTKDPKHLTAVAGRPPNESRYTAIYELDGDTLKICFRERDRPTSFETERGSMWTSHVLKRTDGTE